MTINYNTYTNQTNTFMKWKVETIIVKKDRISINNLIVKRQISVVH